MAGRSTLAATKRQRTELEELARSEVRGEADRTRAILLTLPGWTSAKVAEAFGVTADSVRHWRQWFTDGGVEALRSTLASGLTPKRGNVPWRWPARCCVSRWRTGPTGPCRDCARRSNVRPEPGSRRASPSTAPPAGAGW